MHTPDFIGGGREVAHGVEQLIGDLLVTGGSREAATQEIRQLFEEADDFISGAETPLRFSSRVVRLLVRPGSDHEEAVRLQAEFKRLMAGYREMKGGQRAALWDYLKRRASESQPAAIPRQTAIATTSRHLPL